MTSKKIKELLLRVADEIRERDSGSDEEADVLLNLAGIVEQMDPDTLKSPK
jgi:hypothetical protein